MNNYMRSLKYGSVNLQDLQEEALEKFVIDDKQENSPKLKYGMATVLIVIFGGFIYYRRPSPKNINVG